MASAKRLLIVILCISSVMQGQLRMVKPPARKKMSSSRLAFGVCRSRSVLFLTRNIKEDNDARGWGFNMVYGLTRVIRFNTEYSVYQSINIKPTWLNVRAHSWEVNLNFLSSTLNGKTKFYPLAGFSYNVFDGYFTGTNDHLNLRALYEPNTQVRTRWLGVNTGVGIEHHVKYLSFFGEFKMRVGVSEGYRALSLLDVCFSGGVRLNLRVRSLGQIFSGTRSRYVLDLAPED